MKVTRDNATSAYVVYSITLDFHLMLLPNVGSIHLPNNTECELHLSNHTPTFHTYHSVMLLKRCTSETWMIKLMTVSTRILSKTPWSP
jgi:hypothetical protein